MTDRQLHLLQLLDASERFPGTATGELHANVLRDKITGANTNRHFHRTVNILQREGLIDRRWDSFSHGFMYRLTPAGRDAVK